VKGIAAGRRVAVCLSVVLLPVLTLAEAADPAAASNPQKSSSSGVSAAVLNLPDAPLPSGMQSQNPSPTQPSQNPNNNPNQQPGNAPTLGDLGFTPQQTLANAEMQKRLNERTHDLKMHQTFGLITAVPMCATVIVAGGAKSKRNRTSPNGTVTGPSDSGVDLHVALGSTTALLYGVTAYYAIAAPKIPGVKPKGAIRWHRDLVWIHAPGMVLTPILGAMALSQENNGEHVHGIASAHSYVAWTTVATYGVSIIAVSWPIHLKFWEK